MLVFGVLGLAATKKIDERHLYLSLVGDGIGLAVEVHPDRAGSARQFAAQVNALAGTTATAPAATAAVEGPSIIEQIRQLGELHAAGILTDDEFSAKKAELLSRL